MLKFLKFLKKYQGLTSLQKLVIEEIDPIKKAKLTTQYFESLLEREERLKQMMKVLVESDGFEQKLGCFQICMLLVPKSDCSQVILEDIDLCIQSKPSQTLDKKTLSQSIYIRYLQIMVRTKIDQQQNSQQQKSLFSQQFDSLLAGCSMISEFLKIEFALRFLLGLPNLHKHEKVLLDVTTKTMLECLGRELNLLHQFLDKYISFINAQNNQAFSVNLIYERVVAFGKQSQKLQLLANQIQLNHTFQAYQISPEQNRMIEFQILARKEEHLQWKLSRGKVTRCKKQKVVSEGETMCRLNENAL